MRETIDMRYLIAGKRLSSSAAHLAGPGSHHGGVS